MAMTSVLSRRTELAFATTCSALDAPAMTLGTWS
jgi:hypothetical protein